MKWNDCSSKKKCCPGTCFIHFTFGGTIALYGLGKLLGGTDAWEMVGSMALDLVGLDGVSIVAAITLGLFVALVEFLGGLAFVARCGRTSVLASKLLALIMFIALFVHLKGLDLSGVSGYENVIAILNGIQAPMLYGTVFLAYVLKCCGEKCADVCDTKEKACCAEVCDNGADEVKKEKKKPATKKKK